MEKKIAVYAAIIAIVAIIGIIAVLPGSGIIKNIIPQNQNVPSALTAISTEIKPLDLKYNDSSILVITDRDATVETKFSVINPNNTTVILEMINYAIYANGVLVGHGEFGQRYEGSWESSNYIPLVEQNSEVVTNKAQLHNDGNNPEVWSALQHGTAKITVSGTIYYGTNTVFTGQNLSTDFNFTK